MLFLQPLVDTVSFVRDLNDQLNETYGKPARLANISIQWMAFCFTGIAITGTLCWSRFMRSSGGYRGISSLSWMFRKASIPWDRLLVASVQILIKAYNITEGQLVYDDYDNHRSKKTSRIFGSHKVRNKKGGGFVNAQNIILLLLVTPRVTLTVGFGFYRPDPAKKAWDKEDKRLRKKGIPKSKRPLMPPINLAYPSKKRIAAKLLRQFKYNFSTIKIKSIIADNGYMSKEMRANVKRIYSKAQFLSQLRSTQNVRCSRRGAISIKEYFDSLPTKIEKFCLRAGLEKEITYCSARVFVQSLGRKYHIVAFKYKGEERYRYLVASDLSWHTRDIIRTYAWRWLVEVEIEDTQLFCGYGQLSMQQGAEGARRGMLLSLLFGHFLLQHPIQRDLHRAGQPLATVGSLRNKLQLESFRESVSQALESPDPKAFLKDWVEQVDNLVELRPSRKHMIGHEVQDLQGSPSLNRKFAHTS